MNPLSWRRSRSREFAIGYIVPARSYSQIWCTPMKSSGDLIRLFDLFSVDELHAFNDFGKVLEAA